MTASWEITPIKVQQVIEKIVALANPRKLIFFGSYVQGKAHKHSDLDILIVADNSIESPRKESVRIRRALKGIHMPMDILVVPEDKLEELIRMPGLIYREAVTKGKVVYESAG
jgi:predicted nucleotidyltransferase